MSSRRRYYIFVGFIYGVEEKNWKSEVVFAVCHLPLTSCLTSLTSRDLIQANLDSEINARFNLHEYGDLYFLLHNFV